MTAADDNRWAREKALECASRVVKPFDGKVDTECLTLFTTQVRLIAADFEGWLDREATK